MNVDIILGKTQEHLVPLDGTKFLVHSEMVPSFLKLQKMASLHGLDLQIISAFRSYERQLAIWNAKASGERIVLDHDSSPLDISKMSPREIIFAILRWSALPGCSRHHWGTDVDVFDANTQMRDDVELVPSECEGSGPAASLHQWLSKVIEEDKSFGFYRPYQTERNGISPEPWHLSFYPQARRISGHFTFSVFKQNIERSEMIFKKEILENAHEIYERFVMNFDSP